MERFTEKFKDGRNIIRKGVTDVFHNGFGRFFDGDAVDKLAEYEDLEEQGKLLKLPCAVGDTVYSFSFYRVLTMHVESFITYKDHVDAVLVSDTPENQFLKADIDIKELGNRWFLTREEAEAVLNQ